jgi:hypothetical protein
MTGTRSSLSYRPLPQDDPKRRKPSIDKAAALLGWRPRVDLETGLRATIDYFTLKIFSRDAAAPAPFTSTADHQSRRAPAGSGLDDLISLARSRT